MIVRSTDDVVSAGVRFTTAKDSTKPIAIIWVHGQGVNFYAPSYVGIGREFAGRGFKTLSVNTRMHDIGNVERYSLFGKRVRGGGYWRVMQHERPSRAGSACLAEVNAHEIKPGVVYKDVNVTVTAFADPTQLQSRTGWPCTIVNHQSSSSLSGV